MIKFNKVIVQFGFGAVGKSFYEKVSKEIDFNENRYFVLSKDSTEFEAYINLGGIAQNFITADIKKDNYAEIFNNYLNKGDLLIDFADAVGTKDIIKWCIENSIMYINTGETDWPENWYCIFNENKAKNELKRKYSNIDYPILLQHGNNPGLVSHFVKEGLEYIVTTQHKKNKELKKLLKQGKYNELAYHLELNMIHVNDVDLQQLNVEYTQNTLINTWCIDSFFFEMLSEATLNAGSHEKISFKEKCKTIGDSTGFLELNALAIDTKMRTFYPYGAFDAFLVPHEETITIANSLEFQIDDKIIYRPTVLFLYSPCDYAKQYFNNSKSDIYLEPDFRKVSDCEDDATKINVRGYYYPECSQIAYKEHIVSGCEYVGVLLMGKNFKPVWVGNRVEPSFLYKNKKNSHWQTPTITPVAISALSAVCWMIKNQDKGGVFFPDDIKDYKPILKLAEKYISKTIYKTFETKTIEQSLNVNISDLQIEDFMI